MFVGESVRDGYGARRERLTGAVTVERVWLVWMCEWTLEGCRENVTNGSVQDVQGHTVVVAGAKRAAVRAGHSYRSGGEGFVRSVSRNVEILNEDLWVGLNCSVCVS